MSSAHSKKKLRTLGIIALVLSAALNSIPILIFWLLRPESLAKAPFVFIFHSMLTLIAAAMTIYTLFNYVIQPSRPRMAKFTASLALTLLGHLVIAQTLVQLYPLTLFILNGLLATLYSAATLAAIINYISIDVRLKRVAIWTAPSLIALTEVFGLMSSPWLMLSTLNPLILAVRDLSIGIGFVLPLMIAAAVKGFQLAPSDGVRSLRLRLPLGGALGFEKKSLSAAAFICAVTILLRVLQGFSDQGSEMFSVLSLLLTYHLGFLVFGWDTYNELASTSKAASRHLLATGLLNRAAKNFLQRHNQNLDQWAAVVGFKSSSFMIDHDPQEILYRNLPATLRLIRAEEIHRCLVQMLGSMSLHVMEVGHALHGAVDAEVSHRPCVDILRLFSCLYLEASPLVERRINGLSTLIPVVDPELASSLNGDSMGSLLKRNYWFFALDFGWMDQRVTKSPNLTRYDVNLATTTSQLIMSLRKQERLAQYSNSIWITPEARNKILQEAPSLANIIEASPVSLNHQNPQAEELFFLIKFEQLIPRLQGYFDLDSMRNIILDFEPSSESTRYLNLFKLQIDRAKSKVDIFAILNNMISVPWRGFKEKDSVLRLIMLAHSRIGQLHALSPDAAQEALDQVYDIIQKIGYPSQTLHRAQITKRALRDMSNLIKTAHDPGNQRFAEAWLILSSLDYKKLSPSQLVELGEFLQSLRHQNLTSKSELAQSKSVATLCALATAQNQVSHTQVQATFASLLQWFTNCHVAPDLLCQLLDARQFLMDQLRIEIPLDLSPQSPLSLYISQAQKDYLSSDPKLTSLLSRYHVKA